jgi:hypothetical protein
VRRLALLALLTAACPQTPPSGTSATTGATTSDTTGGSTTDACERSSDCESGGICVSEFVPGPTGGIGGDRGPALCVTVDTCIDALDLHRWCFDHQGCCGDLRCRTGDGVCEPADLGVTTGDSTGSTGEGSGSSSTTTGGSTGETTGETTGSTGDGSTSSTGGASTG